MNINKNNQNIINSFGNEQNMRDEKNTEGIAEYVLSLREIFYSIARESSPKTFSSLSCLNNRFANHGNSCRRDIYRLFFSVVGISLLPIGSTRRRIPKGI